MRTARGFSLKRRRKRAPSSSISVRNTPLRGNRRRPPYTIEDTPEPVNVYGETKVAGEAAVRAACARIYVIRTSWVFGSGKASFLCDVHESLRAGKNVRAIDDIWSSTTFVEDLVDRIQAIVAERRYGIYHVVNAGVCSYYDFALEAGRVLGLERKQIDSLIEITHERDMKRMRRGRATRRCDACCRKSWACRRCATGTRRWPVRTRLAQSKSRSSCAFPSAKSSAHR